MSCSIATSAIHFGISGLCCFAQVLLASGRKDTPHSMAFFRRFELVALVHGLVLRPPQDELFRWTASACSVLFFAATISTALTVAVFQAMSRVSVSLQICHVTVTPVRSCGCSGCDRRRSGSC